LPTVLRYVPTLENRFHRFAPPLTVKSEYGELVATNNDLVFGFVTSDSQQYGKP